MAKIHLRSNKLTGKNVAMPSCASKIINGKVYYNNRDKYRGMSSEIVGFKEFREVASNNRCAHCVDIGLIYRNKHRQAKGFSKVNKIDDAWLEKE